MGYEKTVRKIEKASDIIREENGRRRTHNKKREKLLKKGKSVPKRLPMLKPAFVCAACKSSKYLCGILSQLCDVLCGAGMAYPWRDQEGV